MRSLIAVAALLPLGTLHAAPVPEGGDPISIDAAGDPIPPPWLLTFADDEALPGGLTIGGQALAHLEVHPTGILILNGDGFEPAAPGPLRDLAMQSAIAPFWAALSPDGCDARSPGSVERLARPNSVVVVWRDVPLAGCPGSGQAATFSVELAWDDQAVVRRLEFRYARLPVETLVAEPRAGLRLQQRGQVQSVFELLPDPATRLLRGRAKALLEGSSDGEAGAWTIELDEAGQIAGELEPFVPGPDGQLEPPDGVRGVDNCPTAFNPLQDDLDGDGEGDACDGDIDGDAVDDDIDNCVRAANFDQRDRDGDGAGDACDPDQDGDAWPDILDLCPAHADPGNHDLDRDGVGDACDRDADGDDAWAHAFRRFTPDWCPLTFDPLRADRDHDLLGDACDMRPDVPCVDDCREQADMDGDRVPDTDDICPTVYDAEQRDADGDGRGDACDPDDDGDGILDVLQRGRISAERLGLRPTP